jgi:hypothetical protein
MNATVIVIYAPTRKAAHALRDALIEPFAKLDLPAGIGETHWISVGADSADEPGPQRTPKRRAKGRKKTP